MGVMDQFARPIKVVDASMSASKKMKQQNVNDVIFKKRLLEVINIWQDGYIKA